MPIQVNEAQTSRNRVMLFLGSTSAAQSVELLDTDRRERLAWPFGSDQPFDSGLCRRGWVAVMLGREVLAISDGNLFDYEVLPEAQKMAPAADPELIVLNSRQPGESTVYSLVDRAGNVVRTTSARGRYPVGELASGWIVTPDELVSWRGERRPLP